jgi:DUF1680 family protein
MALITILSLGFCLFTTDHLGKQMEAINDIQPSLSTSATLSGLLGDRYREASRNLLSRPDRYSIDSFKANASGVPGALWWDWPGDQFGRFFSAIHVAQLNGWPGTNEFRKAIGDAILPLQQSDGHFGTDLKGNYRMIQQISGNAFALRGLVDAYEDTHEERYLIAARNLGRFLEKAFSQWDDPKEHDAYEFYGHCIDGLVHLYQQSNGDKWALELAEKIAKLAGREHHTHHSLSMYRGVIELALLKHDKALLEKAEDYLKWCRENRTVTGGLPEGMPKSDQDEGCGFADYVVTNLMMHRATGNDLYLSEAENTLVNHLLMCQFSTGGFGHRQFGQEIMGGKLWQGWGGAFGSENPGCCSIWGQWALGQYALYAIEKRKDILMVNLFPSATVKVPGMKGSIKITSDFPMQQYVCVEGIDSGGKSMKVSIRVPEGVTPKKVTIGRKLVKTDVKDGRNVIDRVWNKDDTLGLFYEYKIVLKPSSVSPDKVAVFKGPLCLGISNKATDIDKYSYVVIKDNVAYSADKEGNLGPQLEPVFHDGHLGDTMNPNRVRVLFDTK